MVKSMCEGGRDISGVEGIMQKLICLMNSTDAQQVMNNTINALEMLSRIFTLVISREKVDSKGPKNKVWIKCSVIRRRIFFFDAMSIQKKKRSRKSIPENSNRYSVIVVHPWLVVLPTPNTHPFVEQAPRASPPRQSCPGQRHR
jgi:hypothetical protein